MLRLACLALVWLILLSPGILEAQISNTTLGITMIANSPVTSAMDGIREGEILIVRTAGQPERRLKVLRISTIPDGPALADVKDQESGRTYTLPIIALAGALRGSSALPLNSPSAAAVTATATPQMNRYSPPTDTAMRTETPAAAPTLTGVPPVVSSSPPPPAAFQRHPFVGKLPAGARPQLTHGTVQPWPQMLPAAATPVTSPQSTVRNAAPVPAWQRPAPVPEPRNLQQTHHPSEYPTATLSESPAFQRLRQAIQAADKPKPVVAQAYVPTPAPVAVEMPGEPAPVHAVSYQQPQPIRAEFSSKLATTLPSQMTTEITPFLHDLKNALRPSLREIAATALAEGRYGSRPEVKAVLAQAAMTDPAPSVRAHCIGLLSSLGYHERQYLDYLRAAGYSEAGEVKSAAVAALARLIPR